jgi:hypothetical protein
MILCENFLYYSGIFITNPFGCQANFSFFWPERAGGKGGPEAIGEFSLAHK